MSPRCTQPFFLRALAPSATPSARILRISGFRSVSSAVAFRFANSRADALRMRFQEVAGTAHGIVGIAYHATRTRLLLRLRLRLNRSGLARAGVALIAAVVAGATA